VRKNDIKAKEKYGKTALMSASESGHVDVVRILLEEWADVDAKDSFGLTALLFATANGHADVAQLLL